MRGEGKNGLLIRVIIYIKAAAGSGKITSCSFPAQY